MVLYKITNKGIIKMIKTKKPLYALHHSSIKTDQNISIALLFATVWIVFIGYLVSVPVNAKEVDYMVSIDMQSYMETIGHGQVFELEDME
jgi:hypothetical protein